MTPKWSSIEEHRKNWYFNVEMKQSVAKHIDDQRKKEVK